MENKKRIDTLIIRFLKKKSTIAEETELDKWLWLNNENREYFEQIQSMWLLTNSGNLPRNEEVDSEWNKFSSKHLHKPEIAWRKIVSVAAAVLTGVFISWFATSYLSETSVTDFRETIINVPYGAKSAITLPDSSMVTLNSGSILRYNSGYGSDNRDLYLTGEAFFDVAKSDGTLFKVITSEVTVKAYGTKFNIKSYEEDSTIETTLIEGSVGIMPNRISDEQTEEIVLKPRERLVYFRSEERLMEINTENDELDHDEIASSSIPEKLAILKEEDIAQYIAWTQDRIVLESEKLQELAIKIERKYNVSISFEDQEIREYRFTGVIENETIESVIKAIAISSSVDYSIHERKIILRKNK